MLDLVLYGVSTTYVGDVAETARRLGARVHAYVVNVADAAAPAGLEPLLYADDLTDELLGMGFVLPMVTPAYRQRAETDARRRGATHFPALVDPTSIVASTVTFGSGAQVNAGAVVGANTAIGHGALVNRSASVAHDVVLEPFATVGPAAVLCGHVHVGTGAFVGAGAVVNPGRTIGANAVVGAGAVVVRDVPANTIVIGNPATVSREAIEGYNGSGVTWT